MHMVCVEFVPACLEGMAADDVLEAGGLFGICGFASVDWITCELACQHLGAPFPCSSLQLPRVHAPLAMCVLCGWPQHVPGRCDCCPLLGCMIGQLPELLDRTS